MKFPPSMAMGAPPKSKPVKVQKIKTMPDHYDSEIRMQNRRLTGVTPKVLGSYGESPARWLKRTSALRMGAGKKVKPSGGSF